MSKKKKTKEPDFKIDLSPQNIGTIFSALAGLSVREKDAEDAYQKIRLQILQQAGREKKS